MPIPGCTPGRWQIGHDAIRTPVVVSLNDGDWKTHTIVCRCFGSNAEANARAFAAVHKLHDAGEQAIGELRCLYDGNTKICKKDFAPCGPCAARESLRAALAAARGETDATS